MTRKRESSLITSTAHRADSVIAASIASNSPSRFLRSHRIALSASVHDNFYRSPDHSIRI